MSQGAGSHFTRRLTNAKPRVLMTRLPLAALFSFLAMLFSAPLLPAQSADEVFKIGVLTELSGAGAQIGQECQRGAEIALAGLTKDNHAGRFNVRLILGDTQDDAKATVSEFKKLIEVDGAETVIMSRSKTAMPVNPLSRQYKIPLVATAGHPALVASNPYAFRGYLNANNEGAFLAEKIFALGLRRVAAVTIQDEWNLAFSTAFGEQFKKLGGTIDFEETLLPGDMDFMTVISRVKRVNPEGVFCNLQLAQSGPFIRKLREQGVPAKLFSNYWLQKPEVQEAAGKEAIEGLMFNEVDSVRPKYLEYVKKLFPDKNSSPGTYICYVATASIIQALNNSQQPGSRKTFAESLLVLDKVTLLDDVIAVRDREVQYPQRMRVIRNGLVEDAGI